ncbi:hypothetical protein [Permianibacter aggregans]|uniref:Uncharacterized protein n=1 Tax=Permianibacter aggregans TaxID=1510150 RepID=A0A4R6UYN5_9GAMM|nr:hypothetical protein [Permianibacter aggregans]QGX38876.1 hypothetical protein E2H98_04035 [Permianibacter aggregans]TDQ50685.1 hypothetical protein EV696_102368 [Permianibacter aggregans]
MPKWFIFLSLLALSAVTAAAEPAKSAEFTSAERAAIAAYYQQQQADQQLYQQYHQGSKPAAPAQPLSEKLLKKGEVLPAPYFADAKLLPARLSEQLQNPANSLTLVIGATVIRVELNNQTIIDWVHTNTR